MPLRADLLGRIAVVSIMIAAGGDGEGLARKRTPGPLPASAPRSMPDVVAQDHAPAPAPVTADAPSSDPLPPGISPAETGPHGTSQAIAGERRYDSVGYASWYGEEMRGGRTFSGQPFNPRAITAAHPSLPMGSFIEVTSLDTGKTIVAMITDRGPTGRDRVLDLSQGAAELLGIGGAGIAAVRVRQIDPTAPDQVALREGRSASPRIDAPPILLTALRKRLPARKAAAAPPRSANRGGARAGVSAGAGAGYATPALTPVTIAAGVTPSAGTHGGFYVQVAAVSSRDRAQSLARSLGGSVSSAGSIYRVRLGPFADRSAAVRGRKDAAQRGYRDARIVAE